jgi:hypothetical protein
LKSCVDAPSVSLFAGSVLLPGAKAPILVERLCGTTEVVP